MGLSVFLNITILSRTPLFITGTLNYSPRKITLTDGEKSYFVKPFSVQKGYIHGDFVKAKITKKGDNSRMAEVEIIHLIRRSEQVLLARVLYKKNKPLLKIISEQGNYETIMPNIDNQYTDGSIIKIRFTSNDSLKIIGKFANESDVDFDEQLILFLSGARTQFKDEVLQEGIDIKSRKVDNLSHRTDFRNWFTFTIDGSDAKDLDDAISIKKDNNSYILAVHIADVSEYVQEGTPIDREALKRATSIYTPGKVIPMLPEILSNDLCSLHPGEAKLSLSCVMEINQQGYVQKADIVEGIIESQHRGVYENIAKYEGNINSGNSELENSLQIAYDLFHILEKRRRKEGKISFESTEIYFDFDSNQENIQKIPKHIRKRERNNAHKLIEEFMVLANEEVAKWCHTKGIPFLSRVHGLPGNEQTEIIQAIIGLHKKDNSKNKIIFGKTKDSKPLEPTDIREFLENIEDQKLQYKYSRLLLPKMAKATYSDTPYRHFGLALEFYSHFTSPIRRYPDLQIHRIIKDYIHNSIDIEKHRHYKSILKRVARNCSEQERSAEDIERAMNSLYICRYMGDKIGNIYSGVISGISDFALFVEIENGIEVTVYLPHAKYNINPIEGRILSNSGKLIGEIGTEVRVKIENVNIAEKRIIALKIG